MLFIFQPAYHYLAGCFSHQFFINSHGSNLGNLLFLGNVQEVGDAVNRVKRALYDKKGGIIAQCECGKEMIKRKPTHPGELLLEDVIKPLGITITGAARKLGVSRKTLSEFVNQKSSLSTEMALRIAKATKTSPESWLNMQIKLDLWNALKHEPENVSEFPQKRAV